MRPSIFCPRCGWIERGRNNIYVLHRLRCESKFSPRSTLMIFALLLVLLEAGLLSSNAIGFFGAAVDEPPNVAFTQASITPSVSLPDPEVTPINALLKKFDVDQRGNRVAEAIVRSSHKHSLDPRLVASILIVESRGNPFAISPSEAVGIMQIHLPTWARTIDNEGINLFKIEDNIDFGVRILSNYVERYGHDEGIKRYNGMNPENPESAKNAEAYLQKVQRIYRSPRAS